jgi:peptidoglycan/LPS O-acetylase OafA/YrhL
MWFGPDCFGQDNMINFKNNNLDLMRLFFAVQVMVMHAINQLSVDEQSDFALLHFMSYLPGVPAFFFVSGFLIYAAYEKSISNKHYFRNRFYRIFPGLFFVSLGGLFFVILVRYLNSDGSGSILEYSVWFVSQITIGQAWNPDSFRDLGLGVVNGALWTITVEILFYIAIPIIFWLERIFKFTTHFLLVLSFVFYYFGESIFSGFTIADKELNEYLTLTPVIWGWMFMFGTLAYKNILIINRYFSYLILGLPVMVVCILGDFSLPIIFESAGNRLGILYFIALSALIIFFGFSSRVIDIKIDLSYGVYIWHSLIINLFLVLDIFSVPSVIFGSLGMALLSWVYVEKPALKMKSNSLRD